MIPRKGLAAKAALTAPPHERSVRADRFLSAAVEVVITTRNQLPTMGQMLDQVLYVHLILSFEVGVTIVKVRLVHGGTASKM